MRVRPCEQDAGSDCSLPVPSRIASNEEFIPPEQSPQQKQYEARLRVKNQIFGLNAARLFGADVNARRNAIRADRLTRLREECRRDPYPSNTQYG